HTPGVYRTAPTTPPPPLTLVRTDIAGFVGYAERGPLPEDLPPGFDASLIARRLTSWDEYQTIYGSFLANGYLPYAVRGFFESGGNRCLVGGVAATRPPARQNRRGGPATSPLPPGPKQPAAVLAAPGAGFTINIPLAPPLLSSELRGALIEVSR